MIFYTLWKINIFEESMNNYMRILSIAYDNLVCLTKK